MRRNTLTRKNSERIFNMVFTALLISIIALMGFVPFLGFIPLGFASVTIIHIPVIIAILFMDWKYASITGLAFGIISWVIAILRPSQPLDYLFQYPYISVLPRFLFAFISAMSLKAIKPKLYRSERAAYITDVVVSFLATLLHSVLVLGSLVIFFPYDIDPSGVSGAITAALMILGTFSMLEAAAAAIIAPAVVKALRTLINS